MSVRNSERRKRWVCGVFFAGLLAISLLTLALSQRPSERSRGHFADISCNNSLKIISDSHQYHSFTLDEASCEEPVLNLAWLKSLDSLQAGAHNCEGFERVCIDQGVLILHDYKYSPVNPMAMDLPSFQVTDLLVLPVSSTLNEGCRCLHFNWWDFVSFISLCQSGIGSC